MAKKRTMFDLSWSEFNDLIFSNDPKIKQLFIIPEMSEKEKAREIKKAKKLERKRTNYPELDINMIHHVPSDDKVRFKSINWFNHLCHHFRVERYKGYFSIQCVTCGHTHNHNHNGLEMDRIYSDDNRFDNTFERKVTKKKRYYYYSCDLCAIQISFIEGSDKWILKRCPNCGSKRLSKHRNIELYDHDSVIEQSECKKLHIQLDGFKKYCKDQFKRSKYIYNQDDAKLCKQIRVKNPYITKDDYIETQHSKRARIILRDK